MDKAAARLTVLFQEPFWVGIFETITGEGLRVCKITFGAEPKDYEVYDFLLKNYERLSFSPAVAVSRKETAVNPKRLQRDAKKQMQQNGIGTKSQQALQLQREQMKTERKALGRQQCEAEERRRFALKQQKRKEKHRGR